MINILWSMAAANEDCHWQKKKLCLKLTWGLFLCLLQLLHDVDRHPVRGQDSTLLPLPEVGRDPEWYLLMAANQNFSFWREHQYTNWPFQCRAHLLRNVKICGNYF